MPSFTAQSPISRRKIQQEINMEKKQIEQKVAAIREIVHTASNNDIILALHNYDMDVNRTIQAFCEDGAQTALDSWQSSLAPSKKKNNNRRKKQQPQASNGSLIDAETLATVSGSQTPLIMATPTSPYVQTNAEILSSGPPSVMNGVTSQASYGYGPPTPEIVKALQQVEKQKNNVSTPQRQEKLFGPIGSQRSNGQVPIAKVERSLNNGFTDSYNDMDDKVLTKELKNLYRHDVMVERVQHRFNEEIDKAQERMKREFKEMKILLAERENYLSSELQRCAEEGRRLLADRVSRGKKLHTRSDQVKAMSDRELNELRNEIKNFVAERRYEEELGQTIRFQWEADSLIQIIKNFGEVVPIKPISAQKHSSHSSLVSSIGEDSGLGMVSPVTPDDKKLVAHVASGGIDMKSDALSCEQLEDLNRRLQESLRAQGIDASILEGVGGHQLMPVRRRPVAMNRGRNRGRNNQQQRHLVRQPQLSILKD